MKSEIKVWRPGLPSFTSNVDQIREEIRTKCIEKYGRPGVPSYVQREVDSYALLKRVSNREALNALITETGSFEKLVERLSKIHAKRSKKSKKVERDRIEAAKKPKSSHSQHQKALDASKLTKYAVFVPGGAPGLGKKA